MSEVSQGRDSAAEAEDAERKRNEPDERGTPGDQERPLTEEETRDEALDETFPASDPVQPSRIDGPNN